MPGGKKHKEFLNYFSILFNELNMQDVLCCVPCSPMRAEASHRSEMVTQLLFGEHAVILEKGADQWIKICCIYDNYEGWCQQSHFIKKPLHKELDNPVLVSSWTGEIVYDGTKMHIPFGSSLAGIKRNHLRWRKIEIRYKGKLFYQGQTKTTADTMEKFAFVFLNTPYLWGGKTVFGTDCSGLTQTVFRFLNIPLPRDAWQQATKGEEVISLKTARRGDLAFFDNPDGKITHVGILLNKKKIIHASGKVRVDKLTSEGIINSDTKQLTHRLKLIRRFF